MTPEHLIDIEVSCSSCEPHPLMVSPYSTAERMNLIRELVKSKSALPYPVVIHKNNGFEVVYGWEVIEVLRSLGVERVKVNLLQEPTNRILHWCITKQAESNGLLWTCIARALLKAKKELKVLKMKSDHETLSKNAGINRSTVTRYLNIASKLHPRLFTLADQGHLTFSHCRKLTSLSAVDQDSLARIAIEKHLTGQALFERAFPSRSLNEPVESTSIDPVLSKSTDIKRMEITIGETLGYPVSITPLHRDGHKGSIEYQFFDRMGMVDLLTKLRQGFNNKTQPKGKIVLTYDSLNEFGGIVGGFFGQD